MDHLTARNGHHKSRYFCTRLFICTGFATLLFIFLVVPSPAQNNTNLFTIQVASCDSAAEAEAIAAQLISQKITAEVSSVEMVKRGKLYRVRVGQFSTINAARLEAEKLRTARMIQSYWIAKTETLTPRTLDAAGVTASADDKRDWVISKEKALPELSLGQFLAALSDRWSVKVPESIGMYAAAIISPQTRSIRTAVVLLDEARIRLLSPALIKRPELLNPLEMRFEPGIKNSPTNTGMRFQQSDQLTQSLRSISGYQDLAFDERGYMVLGKRIAGGSQLARLLLRTAIESNEIFEIESTDGSDLVAFGAFISAQFNNNEKGPVAYNRIQLDFRDFAELRGDKHLLEAFDPGFVFLHEVAHGVWELPDEGRGGLGECEAFINQIRRELGLPERLRYHYQVRGFANGKEQGEMLFLGPSTDGQRRTLKLNWDNRAVNNNTAAPKQPATK